MKIDILGLGESLSLFTPGDNIVFGVNDIFRFCEVDYLVVIDSPNRFCEERFRYIERATPIGFISHRKEYMWRPDIIPIELKHFGEPLDLDSEKINVSLMSPYVATIVAYKMFSPTEINLYGVDITSHPTLNSEKNISTIIKDWNRLKKELVKRNVSVNVYGKGVLT